MMGSLKNMIFRGVRKKQYIGANCLKGWLGHFADLGEGLGKEEAGSVFEWVDTPIHTMCVDLVHYYR